MTDDPTDHTALMAEVGNALAEWSGLEISLADLFGAISDMPYAKVRAVFDRIVDFRLRLQICDWLMDLEDVDAVEAEMWRRASKKIGILYGQRHELAHFALKATGEGAYSIVPFLTLTKVESGVYKELSTNDIRGRTARFSAMANTLTWFFSKATQRRSAAVASQSEHPDPPDVAHLRLLAIRKLEADVPEC